MAGSASVLILGRDAFLLETRRQVLATEGYRVVCVVDAAEVGRQFLATRTALLIICHTVPAYEVEIARVVARSQRPPVPLLVLQTGANSFTDASDTAQVLNVSSGPKGLLAATASLISGTSCTKPIQSERNADVSI